MFANLSTFIAVYETRQFSAAADELRISQSTVSSRIAALERETANTLFERHNGKEVIPTPAGDVLYQAAVAMLDNWQSAMDAATRLSTLRQPLRLLFSHTAVRTCAPAAMTALRPSLERFDITVQTKNSDIILQAVGRKEAELGIIEKPIISEAVHRVPLHEDTLVLAGNVTDNVWLVRERGSGVRYYTELYFKEHDITPTTVVELASNEAIRACLAGGFGQSIISQSVLPDDVSSVELGEEFVRRFFAVMPRTGLSKEQHHAVDAIIEVLKSEE